MRPSAAIVRRGCQALPPGAGAPGRPSSGGDERGAVLVVMAMLIMALLAIAATTAGRLALTESRIAVNHHLHKMAFYAAEGGTQAGMALVDDNIARRGRSDGERLLGFSLDDGDFYLNPGLPAGLRPGPGNQSAHYPAGAGGPPVTHLMMGGVTRLSSGGGIAAFNGYGGAGTAAARGGAWVVFDIRSLHRGRRGNEAVVELFYRHVLF